MRWPSGENATDMTGSACLVNGPAADSPVVAIHTRIVRSEEPETMRWPSGENPTDKTESVCPVSKPVTVSPVVAFHTQIVPSPEPETMRWPSGESATEMTLPPKVEITNSDDGQSDNRPRSTRNIRGNELE